MTTAGGAGAGGGVITGGDITTGGACTIIGEALATSAGAVITAAAGGGAGSCRRRGPGAGSGSGSRMTRSKTGPLGPDPHVIGEATRRTESQSGVDASSGGAGTRGPSGSAAGRNRTKVRNGSNRLRHPSRTSGAATRWTSGPGA